jgi:CRP/FNR family nitrogen fixation transcriptional regulator
MHMHTAIRAVSFTQPPTQAKNLPLSNGRASADVIELMGTVIPFARNTEVYGENEPAEYLYKVISGTVRTCKCLDGRRQIGAFMSAAMFSASRPVQTYLLG